MPAVGKPRLESQIAAASWSSNAGLPARPSIGEALLSTISPDPNSGISISGLGRGLARGRPLNNNNNNNNNEHGMYLTPCVGHSGLHGSSCIGSSNKPIDGSDLQTTGVDEGYSFKFAAEVIRLISLVLQVMGPSFCLKDLCERSGPDFNNRCSSLLEGGFHTLAVYLGQLIVPLLFRCSAGRKGENWYP
ncbi:hypothetical protein AHF37_01154 [Paragonimus kellicotti]|nr:hypothetical protein AHF37_01154 [Paragonimus kellicotti]